MNKTFRLSAFGNASTPFFFCDNPLSGKGMKEHSLARARQLSHKEAIDTFQEQINENPHLTQWIKYDTVQN